MRVVFVIFCLLHAASSQSCPGGWTQGVTNKKKCFKGFRDEATWFDAMQFCQQQGSPTGTLVSIHSAIENMQIATIGQQTFETCLYWTGLQDFDASGAYTWIDGSPVDYTNWAPDFPLVYPEGTAVYMSLQDRNRWMATGDIAETNCFVCQQNVGNTTQSTTLVQSTTTSTRTTTTTSTPIKTSSSTTTTATTSTATKTTTSTAITATTSARLTTKTSTIMITPKTTTTGKPTTSTGHRTACDFNYHPFNDYCYRAAVRTERVDYPHAIEICRLENGDLASIHSEEENNFVKDLAGTFQPLIGLQYDASAKNFSWSDGTPVDYTNLRSTFQAYADYFGYCAKIADPAGDPGKWENAECEQETWPFMCKNKPTEFPSDPTTGCPNPEKIYIDSGVVASPGYPVKYISRTAICKYHLAAKNGHLISLNIDDIDLPYVHDEDFDEVIVYEGLDQQKLLGRYYRTYGGKVTTSELNHMEIVFITNSNGDGKWKGTFTSISKTGERAENDDQIP